MLSIRQSVVAVLSVASSLSFAGAMGPVSCVKENLTLPCECQSWTFAGRALYLQSNTSLYNNKGILSTTPFVFNSDINFNPGWDWGFQLEAGYHFSPSSDVNVNWYHFRQSNTQSIPGKTIFNTYVSSTLYDNLTVNPGQFSINPQWDQVNIEFGKLFELGQSDNIRAHGGFNYSRVANSGIENYGGNFTASIGIPQTITFKDTRNESYSMTYNGFGVRTGIDLTHKLDSGFALYANGAASLLAGTTKSDVTGSSSNLFNNLFNTYSGNDYSNRNIVVPELDAKIGINYNYCMTQGNLIADAGWLWVNYFNVLDNSVTLTNFGIQGLYFGLKYQAI